MKIRKNAFALLIVITTMSLLGENKAKAIVTVTNEKNIVICQSTSLDNRQEQDNYILLNRPNETNNKEYLNGFITYTEKGMFVDGIDPVPLELFQNKEGYLSLGFQLTQYYSDHCQIDISQNDISRVIDIGDIELSLTEDPIYWRITSNKDMYGMTKGELDNWEYIRIILPKRIEGLKGYMAQKEADHSLVTVQVDLVPFDTASKESILELKNTININDLAYNKRQYQYILENINRNPILSITANYNFKLNISRDDMISKHFAYMGENDSCNNIIEGEITFIINYEITGY